MDDLIERLRRFRDDRDWAKFHTPKNLAVSISIEAGELLEHFQWTQRESDLTEAERAAIGGELADVLIYLLMLFDRMGMDPQVEAQKKMAINEKRFPVGSRPGKHHRRK